MKLVNTSQRKFLSQSPITILNKTAPCGAMRPIAYFAVEIPRTGSHLSAAPLKETFTYEGKDGNFKSYSKNQSSPCGDSFTPSVGFGILEVPLHSVHDPNNVVADQHHNMYVEENRKGAGSYSAAEESILANINAWTRPGWKSMSTTSGNFFKGIDSKGDDILAPVYVDGENPDDDHDDDAGFGRTMTYA